MEAIDLFNEDKLKITKSWSMPNKNTFNIKPVKELIDKHIFGLSIDPFANSSQVAQITNDLDAKFKTNYNLDALDFLKKFNDESVDFVLFDPPYSSRQVSEVYKKMGKSVNMETTQSSFWAKIKAEISRIVKSKGKVITFGWNSGGIGEKYGFKQIEIMIVAHGGWHNDTIVTVERKI